MPASRASIGVRKVTGLPSSRISPLSGISAPESALIRLDLPAPLSPITARISPGYNSRSLPSIATTRPYRLVNPFACKTGVNVAVMLCPPSACPSGPRLRCPIQPPRSPPKAGLKACQVRLNAARCRRSCLHLPDPLVDRDGDKNEQTDREALPDHLDTAELQAVAEHPDDQRTDQRADHAAATAEEARAAEHHRG